MTSKRLFITEPEEWIEAAKAQAEKENKTLSEWVGEAMLAKLPAKVRAKLPVERPAGRPKKDRD
jgi:hypothetical protein